MSRFPKLQNHPDHLAHFSPGKAGFWGVLTFFMVFFGWSALGQDPVYNHIDGKNLDLINIKFADVLNIQPKINRVIISVDVNANGEVYVLTFGNGIKKIGPNGELLNFINSDNMVSPLDFAINSEGKFFVADNESNSRFVRVYSPTGVYLPNETLGDGSYGNGSNKFRGPTGLAFDKNDNLYVADHYIGNANPPPSNPSFIKIYSKDASGSYKNNLLKEFDKIDGDLLNFPYRIAVDSRDRIYVSELGTGNGRVLVLELDASNNPRKIGEISGLASQIGDPGSIIIDKFDNIFITDFGPTVKMTTILEAANDPFKLIAIFDDIKAGIANNVFKINIYNPDRSYFGSITNEVDLAVDLAMDNCGKLYVNNTMFSGRTGSPPFYFAMDVNLDFDLEIYQRAPGYDTENPSVVTCPNSQTGTLTNGQFILPDYRNLAKFSDNCDDDLEIIQNPPKDTPITESAEVFITAKDASGNTAECSFTVTITENTDTEAPVITCPSDFAQNVDSGTCGAIVNYVTPTATDNSGSATISLKSGPASGSLFPVGITEVTFEAEDGEGNKAECSFSVNVLDNEFPAITCPSNITGTVAIGQTNKVVTYTLPVFNDNCPGTSIFQTAGLASGSNFPLGISTNTFVVTDASGNTTECSFTVILTADSDTENPVITCPAAIVRNVDSGTCGAIVNYAAPTATDNSGSTTISLKSGPASGSLFPIGITTVTFEATDATGNTSECSFTVTVSGTCKEIPVTGFEHISIYPNPTPGPFAFDTPNGWSIEKVEVFDTRGRYVLTETYLENDLEYSMDLSSLQEAVYILKLFTSQGIKVLRVIIN